MSLLLIAVAVLAGSGVLALLCGRRALPGTLVGAAGAVVGGVLGLVPTMQTLIRGTTERLDRPWDVPFGSFAVELDPLSALFLVPVLGLTALAALAGGPLLWPLRDRKALGVAWFFYNLMAAAMVLVVLARNGVLFLVAWEVMSLASYFLVVLDDGRAEVREAGRTYLIATHLGTAFLLVLFVALGSGPGAETLDFGGPGRAIPPWEANALFLIAVVGFGTKAGFMPFHVWLPEAYPAAPGHVPAVMSGAMSKMGIYGLVRTLSLLPIAPMWWGYLLIGIGIVSGVWGILLALPQHDLKRLLAYSSIENVGIIAMGLGIGLMGLGSDKPALAMLGFTGALLHVLNHALFKGLLFLGAGAVVHATGTGEIDRLGGLSKRMPWLSAAFLVGSVAIAGLPPLNGFVGEFLIYSGAFREGLALDTISAVPALAVIAALGLIGGLAAIGFAKVYGIAFLGEPRTESAANSGRIGPLLWAPPVVLATSCVLVGLFSRKVVSAIMPAVARIMHESPEAFRPQADDTVAPLSSVTQVLLLLVGLVAVLAVVRKALLSGREVTASGTWGCGYARPTVRMQYTASSFVQPAVDFFAPFLRTRTRVEAPSGLFPGAASFSSTTPDLSKDLVYRPLFHSVGWTLSRLRWLQHGHVHVYVLYVGATLVALLVWYLGLERL